MAAGIERITHERFVELLEGGLEDRCGEGAGCAPEVHYAGQDPIEEYREFARHGGTDLAHYRAGHVLGAHCPGRGAMFVTYATERVRRLGIDSVSAYARVHHGTCPDVFAQDAKRIPAPYETGVPFI